MISKAELCAGHMGSCPGCRADEKNKQCPGYKPIAIHFFDVSEETTGKLPEKNEYKSQKLTS